MRSPLFQMVCYNLIFLFIVESIQIRKNLLTHQFCGVVHVILKTESLVPDVLKIAVEVNGVYIFKKQTL